MHDLSREQQRRARLRKVVMVLGKTVIFAFAALFAIMCWTEVYQIGSGNIEGYPWGWEGGGWQYDNPTNYMITSIIGGAVSTLILLGFLVRKRWPWLFYGFTVLLILLIVINAATIG